MLSKKMTFSLMSLITLLAFAFVAPSAIAAIGSSVVMTNDIGHADGLQLEHTGEGDVTVTIRFGMAVPLTAANLSISVLDEDGAFLEALIAQGDDDDSDVDNEFAVNQTGVSEVTDWNVVMESIAADARTIKIRVAKDVVAADAFSTEKTEQKDHTVTLLGDENDDNSPDVLKIALVGEPFSPITTATFDIHVLLSEEPKDAVKDLIEPSEADVDKVVKLGSPADAAQIALFGRDDGELDTGVAANSLDSWRDGKNHLYLVTLKPKAGEKTVTIKIKNWAGMEKPAVGADNVIGTQQMYIRRADDGLTEGRDILTLKTKTDDGLADLTGGVGMFIPHGEAAMIPAGGYLVLTTDKGASGVAHSHEKDEENIATKQTPGELLYNTRALGLPNLLDHLTNGGTIILTTSDAVEAGSVVISEIMWGTDTAQDPIAKSQWIEIHNTTDTAIAVGEKKWALFFFNANDALPAADAAFVLGADAAGTAIDSAGTRDESTGAFWSLAGKGQGGQTALDEVSPVIDLVSMQRAADAAGVYADGNIASSWSASDRPSINLAGARVGTPGASPVMLPEVEVEEEEPEVPVAMPDDIKITEIMVDTGDGRLPQWIELTNVSGADASLAGWSVAITNSAADADAVGALISINLSGTLGVGGGEDAGGTMGKSLLLVAWDARNSRNLDGNERVVDVSDDVGQTGRYKLISDMAFMIALIPPQTSGVLTYGDTAGNLGAAEAWDIPMSEGGRSSLIRREADALGTATLGTAANGWVLASSTSLVSGPATWYGSDEDAGTPGYDAGGPLPVELSHFRPARDKDTGAAVITWSTQSELNNAGFFIKRSQQRDGQFKVINAAMIQGAGTTSEKQFYTYTDTTAQPNVVYYYQIEDVSLDGNRQTLTNGIRLKGHIGAAGKLTTLWGDLKTSQ